MSIDALEIIKNAMKEMKLSYSFMEYKIKSGETLPKTYFIGEYQELEPTSEDGEQDNVFILTGFSRDTWIRLEEAKNKIKKYFPLIEGKTATTESGSVVAVFYSNGFPVPTEDAELKKMQINLTVKEWRKSDEKIRN